MVDFELEIESEETLEILRSRASLKGQTVEEYVRAFLIEHAAELAREEREQGL
jgi:hypothetical protein